MLILKSCFKNTAKYNGLYWFSRCLTARRFVTSLRPSNEDQLIRDVFDQKCYGNNYKFAKKIEQVGLFKNRFLLDKDQGFIRLAEIASMNCKKLIEEILNDDSNNTLNIIRCFDRISNLLCSVIDLLEFVRCSHPNTETILKAEEAYNLLFELMNILNTHQGLYNKLRESVSLSPALAKLDSEAYNVAKVFLQDFEKSGVNLNDSLRKKFVKQSMESSTLGRRFFNQSMNKPQRYISVPLEVLGGSDPYFVSCVFDEKQKLAKIPTVGYEGAQALVSIANPEVRKQIYIQGHYGTEHDLSLFESYMDSKNKLAKIVGKDSFAELQLLDKMAQSPNCVINFLENLSKKNLPNVRKIHSVFSRMKQKELGLTTQPEINIWDREYYVTRYKQQLFQEKSFLTSSVAYQRNYLTVGTVIQGLSRLFNSLYGLRFVPAEVMPGEIWDPDVRKLNVLDEKNHLIGTIYFDLFIRPGKTDGAAHFTIRSSRELDRFSINDSLSLGFDDYVSEKNQKTAYQIPIISLLCNFQKSNDNNASYLDLWDVKTLFHEMGHAMHSILGRTKYQNLAGTRCATDFVELPSIIMEHFMASSEVLPLYARHYQDDKPFPSQILGHYNQVEDSCVALDLQSQICMSMIDQVFHSDTVSDPGYSSNDVVHQISNRFSGFESVPKTSWHLQFSHLYGYSATYYSYLFDTALASLVFRKLFSKNPLSREAGEKFRNTILKWGGSRNPWECIAEALEDPIYAEGGEKAMQRIGNNAFNMSERKS
ncbi:intermediate peptidase Oct1 [Schizosaccharomyces cryophilus OY26]|uniref:Mitochondrial intermediate peptidase n=1 Tax=Schizosaccharomyces cryophilus (strain OY26 / ATCC MYA-4695 / CBS 11777 / NBRC 106824 / NRRL Y48691) TaxID=653667 RepID=S9W8H7_SCHCR|nr:intermediate peptidase Oct1 [Schizosaccharomyces cryophilus OY26]EPY54185.1 intermediate peptidase Oct1 [Schizosaccharomyces cryophilus OY26]